MAKPVSLYAMALGPSFSEISEQVRGYDSSGLDGVMATDHLFVSRGQDRRAASRGPEPFIRLAAAGALSQRLVLGTVVVNVGLQHPALALRQFVELGSLFGGDRILAGIGAGWNPEEFDALGLAFDPLSRRLHRLDEACRLFRSIFDTGMADAHGDQVVARNLPMGPPLRPPPRLLLGGGSDRMLEIAGLYADVVDLNGSSRRLSLGGAHPVFRDAIRRLTTTLDDLAEASQRVRSVANNARRDPNRIEFSVLVSAIRFCAQAEIDQVEGEICRRAGMDPISLAACPYVFVGPVERMREQLSERIERIGLRHLFLNSVGLRDMARFRQEVCG